MERRALSEKETLLQFQNKLLLIQKKIQLINYSYDDITKKLFFVNTGLWKLDYYKHDRLLDYFNQILKAAYNSSEDQYNIETVNSKYLFSVKRNLALSIKANKAARIGYNELIVISEISDIIIPWNLRNVAKIMYSLAYEIECWISVILKLDISKNFKMNHDGEIV
jgi:hypothetical protein